MDFPVKLKSVREAEKFLADENLAMVGVDSAVVLSMPNIELGQYTNKLSFDTWTQDLKSASSYRNWCAHFFNHDFCTNPY